MKTSPPELCWHSPVLWTHGLEHERQCGIRALLGIQFFKVAPYDTGSSDKAEIVAITYTNLERVEGLQRNEVQTLKSLARPARRGDRSRRQIPRRDRLISRSARASLSLQLCSVRQLVKPGDYTQDLRHSVVASVDAQVPTAGPAVRCARPFEGCGEAHVIALWFTFVGASCG